MFNNLNFKNDKNFAKWIKRLKDFVKTWHCYAIMLILTRSSIQWSTRPLRPILDWICQFPMRPPDQELSLLNVSIISIRNMANGSYWDSNKHTGTYWSFGKGFTVACYQLNKTELVILSHTLTPRASCRTATCAARLCQQMVLEH